MVKREAKVVLSEEDPAMTLWERIANALSDELADLPTDDPTVRGEVVAALISITATTALRSGITRETLVELTGKMSAELSGLIQNERLIRVIQGQKGAEPYETKFRSAFRALDGLKPRVN